MLQGPNTFALISTNIHGMIGPYGILAEFTRGIAVPHLWPRSSIRVKGLTANFAVVQSALLAATTAQVDGVLPATVGRPAWQQQ
jgi:hypothetical protein